MKRLVCLLLVVSIACAGCYDTEIGPSGRPIIHVQPEDRMDEPVLGPKVPKPVREPIKLKAMAKQIEALRVRIVELEAEIELQGAELRADIKKFKKELSEAKITPKQYEVLLVRIAELEAEIESQREEFESSQNIYRLYEVAIESQKVAIESLEKLCRMYEAEIDSQGKSRSSEESPLGKEPEISQ